MFRDNLNSVLALGFYRSAFAFLQNDIAFVVMDNFSFTFLLGLFRFALYRSRCATLSIVRLFILRRSLYVFFTFYFRLPTAYLFLPPAFLCLVNFFLEKKEQRPRTL